MLKFLLIIMTGWLVAHNTQLNKTYEGESNRKLET